MLEQIKTEHPDTQVIILTAHDSLNNAIESIKRGAYHFISKPYAPEELLSLVEKALEKQSLLRETHRASPNDAASEEASGDCGDAVAPVFKSKAMQEIDELITAMAPSEANVLITGESGVGKEVIANVIHSRSRRAEKPMVKLNCAAFPQAMIEGELFGYVKGAFTGATNDFRGMIAEADGSTLSSMRFPRCRRNCRLVFCASCRSGNFDRSARLRTRISPAASREISVGRPVGGLPETRHAAATARGIRGTSTSTWFSSGISSWAAAPGRSTWQA